MNESEDIIAVFKKYSPSSIDVRDDFKKCPILYNKYVTEYTKYTKILDVNWKKFQMSEWYDCLFASMYVGYGKNFTISIMDEYADWLKYTTSNDVGYFVNRLNTMRNLSFLNFWLPEDIITFLVEYF